MMVITSMNPMQPWIDMDHMMRQYVETDDGVK